VRGGRVVLLLLLTNKASAVVVGRHSRKVEKMKVKMSRNLVRAEQAEDSRDSELAESLQEYGNAAVHSMSRTSQTTLLVCVSATVRRQQRNGWTFKPGSCVPAQVIRQPVPVANRLIGEEMVQV
jgi:hypothetical protein